MPEIVVVGRDRGPLETWRIRNFDMLRFIRYYRVANIFDLNQVGS